MCGAELQYPCAASQTYVHLLRQSVHIDASRVLAGPDSLNRPRNPGGGKVGPRGKPQATLNKHRLAEIQGLGTGKGGISRLILGVRARNPKMQAYFEVRCVYLKDALHALPRHLLHAEHFPQLLASAIGFTETLHNLTAALY